MSEAAVQAPETADKPTAQAGDGASTASPDALVASSATRVAESKPNGANGVTTGELTHREGAPSHGSAARPAAASVEPVDDEERRPLPSLSRGDVVFVSIMLAAIFVLTLFQIYRRYGWDAREIEVLHPADYQFTLDINSATWVEWLQLDGVGEVLARRIVEYREQHGPFRSIDDLNNVHGIGDVKLEQMRPHLRLDPVSSEKP